MTPTHEMLRDRAILLSKKQREVESETLDVLMQMERQKSFFYFGFAGMWDFCIREMKLSEAQTAYYCKVARLSLKVPEVKKAIDDGKISLSKARRIEPVVTMANVDEWIGKAATLKQKDLEREVAIVNPRAATRETIKPVALNRNELKVGISDELEKKLRRLSDVLGKSLEATLDAAVTALLEKKDPEKKAERAVAKNLPRKAQVPTPGKRQPIPAFSRHATYLDQGMRCSHYDKDGKRCQNQRYLQMHHLKPVSERGTNDPENLTLLCAAHHKMQHLPQRGFPLSSTGNRQAVPRDVRR